LSCEISPPRLVEWRLPSPDARTLDPAYQHALAWIFAFSEAPRTPAAVELGRARKLDRMRMLLGLLGSPQARFSSILVAGTKGKGSMAAWLAAILTAAGYRVGRYTQPHLYSYRERTWACGRHIDTGEIVSLLDAMRSAVSLIARQAREVGPLTTFDVGTALSLAYFAQRMVEVAVVEVGVGGASDATNLLEPVVSLIGPVGLDHVDTLGPDLRAIAREKAGVVRGGADVIVGRQEPDALAVIEAVARRAGARAWMLGRDYWTDAEEPCRGPFSLHGSFGSLADLTTPLEGDFQRDNAATAIAAARALAGHGWVVSEDAIRTGLANVSWPGRFQTVVREPLTIVDGAHNVSAARALASTARTCLSGRCVTLVVGMSEGKDSAAFISELASLANRAIVTRARHVRSTDPSALHAALSEQGVPAHIVPTPGDAVRRAWAELPAGGAVLVTGSLFLVGDVMEWLLELQDSVPEGVR
jgi:dihydrofolate synthase/folylpolyglutamate synthase